MRNSLEKISEYLDIMNADENADYAYLEAQLRKISELAPNVKIKSEFQWLIARLHTDMVNLHSTIKLIQDALRDADKQIQ